MIEHYIMVYIRVKQVKNIGYAYLVESKWNKEKHTSQQIIKRYLGPVSHITVSYTHLTLPTILLV